MIKPNPGAFNQIGPIKTRRWDGFVHKEIHWQSIHNGKLPFFYSNTSIWLIQLAMKTINFTSTSTGFLYYKTYLYKCKYSYFVILSSTLGLQIQELW